MATTDPVDKNLDKNLGILSCPRCNIRVQHIVDGPSIDANGFSTSDEIPCERSPSMRLGKNIQSSRIAQRSRPS